MFANRPAVVDEDYREPYNIWKETLGHRDKRINIEDQNEYNGEFAILLYLRIFLSISNINL